MWTKVALLFFCCTCVVASSCRSTDWSTRKEDLDQESVWMGARAAATSVEKRLKSPYPFIPTEIVRVRHMCSQGTYDDIVFKVGMPSVVDLKDLDKFEWKNDVLNGKIRAQVRHNRLENEYNVIHFSIIR